jgi:uncharacterized protein
MSEQPGRREIDLLLSLHIFSMEGHHYAVDGASGRALSLDAAAVRGMERLRRAPREVKWPVIGGPALGGGLRELAMFLVGSARAEERSRLALVDPDPPTEVELCLCATFRCDLACHYCFVRLAHGDRHDARTDMSLATAKAAVDLFLGRLHPQTERLSVTFGHTGEPLLVRALYEQLREYLLRKSRETGREILCNTSATNLTLAKWPDLPPMSWLSVSLDGPRRVHDRVRVFPDGRGSYDIAAPRLREVMASASFEPGEVQASAILTAHSTDIKGIFLHLVSLGGPRVTMCPVRLPPTSDLAITESVAGGLLYGYDELLSYLLTLEHEALVYYLKRLVDRSDYFGRYFLRVATGKRGVRRCSAGIGMFAVVPSGKVFPCASLGVLGRLYLGAVQHGIDEPSLLALRRRRVWDTAACVRCWARLICGGDCLSSSALYEPYGKPPDPGICALSRGLIERAIHFLARLRQERADVLAALPGLGTE